MTRYIVDAGVAVKWYVPEIYSDIAENLLDENHELNAPDLILPEFGAIIWKKVRRNEMTSRKGRQIIEAFLNVPVSKYSATNLLDPAYEIAIQTDQTVYDSIYLALAIAADCELATADEKFYQAINRTKLVKHIIWIENLPR